MNFLSLGPDYDIAYDRITESLDWYSRRIHCISSNSLGSVAMNAMYEFLNSCMIKRKTDEIQNIGFTKNERYNWQYWYELYCRYWF